MTIGWKLTPACRERLLERFAPRYPRVVADHVTLATARQGEEPPPPVGSARVVGRADDDAGVEALVVAIDGGTGRPDGSTWHVTWSLGESREARESNDIIAARGWLPSDPIALELVPARW